MKTPYGLPIIPSCYACPDKLHQGLCDLPDSSLKKWNEVRHNSIYPRSAILFVQDQAAHGLYFVCSGSIKLYTSLSGTVVIFRIVRAGETAGLSETLLGTNYQVTAETLEPSVLNFIYAADLKKLIRTDSEIAMRVSMQLSQEIQLSRSQIRELRFRDKATERLASFLLSFAGDDGRLTGNLSMEDIADFLGVRRETISRAIRELKDCNLIRVSGHRITIVDRNRLIQMSVQSPLP